MESEVQSENRVRLACCLSARCCASPRRKPRLIHASRQCIATGAGIAAPCKGQRSPGYACTHITGLHAMTDETKPPQDASAPPKRVRKPKAPKKPGKPRKKSGKKRAEAHQRVLDLITARAASDPVRRQIM